MIRALITSGGGAKGAFTVGALNELADMGIDQYDIISGTTGRDKSFFISKQTLATHSYVKVGTKTF